jgi:TetR/AcrR family transcriptional regulator
VHRRNAERTRGRIITAARKEFSRSGFEGSRVGAIARRAGINPSLIFYYFQNKAGLYRAVSEQRLASYAPPFGDRTPTREEVLEWPLWLFRLTEETQDAIRQVLREGIGTERSRPPLIEEERRRESFQQQVARVRGVQRAGGLPSDLDAEHLTLLLYMLGVYPYMLPQSAHLIAGGGPEDPAFRSSFESFVRDLVRVFDVEASSSEGAAASA